MREHLHQDDNHETKSCKWENVNMEAGIKDLVCDVPYANERLCLDFPIYFLHI